MVSLDLKSCSKSHGFILIYGNYSRNGMFPNISCSTVIENTAVVRSRTKPMSQLSNNAIDTGVNEIHETRAVSDKDDKVSFRIWHCTLIRFSTSTLRQKQLRPARHNQGASRSLSAADVHKNFPPTVGDTLNSATHITHCFCQT